eukprot:8261077-Pyramimonas_sp.AAC.2
MGGEGRVETQEEAVAARHRGLHERAGQRPALAETRNEDMEARAMQRVDWEAPVIQGAGLVAQEMHWRSRRPS